MAVWALGGLRNAKLLERALDLSPDRCIALRAREAARVKARLGR